MLAAAGPLALTGDADRAPVRVAVPQAFLHAGAEAAVGALIALHERARSGRGQHVDVSAQQAATLATQSYLLATPVGSAPATRVAGGIQAGPLRVEFTYPAKDGHVSITFLFGTAIGPVTRRLMEWVYDGGCCDEATRDKDWIAYTELLTSGEEPIAEFERVKQVIEAFTATKTKAELLEAALDRHLLIAPARTIAEVVESAQLAARELLADARGARRLERPLPRALREASRPRRSATGAARRASASTPRRSARSGARPRRRRRRSRERGRWRAARSTASRCSTSCGRVAGPLATRALADYGATVVRIESSRRLDACRTLAPFLRGEVGTENAALFHTTNAGKRMLTLDPGKPEGRQVVLDLVRWADVVCESFTPQGACSASGLDYETLRQVKPDLIMLTTCLMGQTGPLASFAGYGNLAAAITGFYELTAGPTARRPGPSAPTPTTSRRASTRARSWPRSTTAAAPARASTSTCRRPRRRCTSSRPRSSTTP